LSIWPPLTIRQAENRFRRRRMAIEIVFNADASGERESWSERQAPARVRFAANGLRRRFALSSDIAECGAGKTRPMSLPWSINDNDSW
jgi:hypothetical protein